MGQAPAGTASPDPRFAYRLAVFPGSDSRVPNSASGRPHRLLPTASWRRSITAGESARAHGGPRPVASHGIRASGAPTRHVRPRATKLRPARIRPARKGDFMDRSHTGCPIALVVEDDADVRNLATAVLEETDLDVIACASAEAAISVLERAGGHVALLFADVRLGAGMDGIALATTVERRWPDVRVVLTSGATRAASTACRPRPSTCRSPGAPSTCWSRPSTRRWRRGPPDRRHLPRAVGALLRPPRPVPLPARKARSAIPQSRKARPPSDRAVPS